MSDEWRNELATEQQIEKLRFFGCTWDEGITAGQAGDALEECARQFPDAEVTYQKNLLATEKQKDWLRFFRCSWNGDITQKQADDALELCAKQYPDRQIEAEKWFWQLDEYDKKQKILKVETIPKICLAASQQKANATAMPPKPPVRPRPTEIKEAPSAEVTIQEAEKISPSKQNLTAAEIPQANKIAPARREGFFCGMSKEPKPFPEIPKRQNLDFKEVTPQRGKSITSPVAKLPALNEFESHISDLKSDDKFIRKRAVIALAESKNPMAVKPLISMLAESEWWRTRMQAAQSLGLLKSAEAIEALVAMQKARQFNLRQAASVALKQIRESGFEFSEHHKSKIEPKKPNPQDYTISALEVQAYAQRQPAIRRPATFKITTSIERFEEWLDNLLERNQTIMGGHWLPVGSMSHVFASDAITISLCREIADMIESKGYCVEPDARFGNGTYDRNQTLALFKPLSGEAIKPSTTYLGATNLLRLCVLIATADGKLDLEELDVFRSAIEYKDGLSKTDHKRLIVLEQLLAQELCSASKAVARIAKSVSPENRLVIGKLLVEVAAVNQVITSGERRALEQIFKAFEIRSSTLQEMISENQLQWKWPRSEPCQDDVSKNDTWLWNHWRTGHPDIVIDDNTLAKKTWNFNDWKVLNARWRALYERLDPQTSTKSDEASKIAGGRTWREEFEDAGRNLGIKSEQPPKPIPAPKSFSLDMDKVYAITSETKEVVAILSVLMEDEQEKSIAPSSNITLPVPEIPKVSNDGNAAPQSTRFNGLDAAFHPILKRLLARDSWSKNDFKFLADEFHFMPLNIRDTLNEWSDETLGDYILDGEDPLIVHRELIGKDKVYG